MTHEIILTHNQLKIVKDILQLHLPAKANVWVFGSRATGKVKPYSDLDLAVDIGVTIPIVLSAKLNDAFDESPLPFKVDIVDWQSISESFRKKINDDRIPLIFTS